MTGAVTRGLVTAPGETVSGADAPPGARRKRDTSLAVLVITAVGVWLALIRLGVAFWRSSLDWEYVAEQSRVGAPWYYRIAGVWGGMEGSLLLFVCICAVAAVLAGRHATTGARWAAVATLGVLLAANLAFASPFQRLDVPATEGFGLTPILEHPAMAIHPPLLYTGLAASGGAALVAVGAVRPFAAARRWLLATLSLLAAAMTLGAAWSYMEQGWGGYWAWDPVENTSLLVWLAALLAVHAAPRVAPRWAMAWSMAPWVVTLFGAALVRSGRTPSVHGFAEQLEIGWAILALALVTAAACAVAVRRAPSRGTRTRRATDPRRVTVVLAASAAVVVAAGTVWPVVADVFIDRSTAVRGEYYGRIVGPLATAAAVFLVLRLAGADGRRRVRGWSTVAHAAALVLLAGVAASTFDRASTVPIRADETVDAAGVAVRNYSVTVGDGPRRGTDAVTATVGVDGRAMRPRLVVYPERGGRLAEIAVHTGPLTDVHVVLERAADDGSIVVTVQRRHGMWLVWLGAIGITVATLAAARRP